ncbi:MAG: leucine-rich repeat domain-containing protein [Limisphaerales bacterium]
MNQPLFAPSPTINVLVVQLIYLASTGKRWHDPASMKGIFLALFGLLLLAAAATVYAQSGSGDNFNYSVNPDNTNTITITGYIGTGGDVTIPTNINGLTVTDIGGDAFAYCSTLHTVTIADGVTSIGYEAFMSSSLTSAVIPNSVTNITSWAFSYCLGLTSVTIGNSISTIEYGIFYDCPNLTNVTIGNGVTSIWQEAFFDCPSLTGVYFQGNAPAILDSLVFDPDNNTTIYYLPGTSGWSSTFDSIPAVMLNAPIPAGSLQVIISPDGAITNGTQWQVDGGIPQPSGATVLGLTIGIHMVSFSAINGYTTPSNQTVLITSNSTAIVDATYGGGSLQVIINPIEAITSGAQWQVDGGTNENSGATVNNLSAGEHTISFTAAFGWYMPPSQTITITDGSTTTATGIYVSQYIYTTNADNTLTITGYTGPGGDVIIPVSINNLTVTSIGDGQDYVFAETGVTSVTIPNSMTSIGDYAFAYASLTNLMIPSSVTNIGEGAFASETSLTAIDVDAQNAFYRSVDGVLFDTGQSTLLQYPSGLSGSYTIPDSVTSIGDLAFGYSGLTSVTIPGSVTNIGDQAFAFCASLTAITVDTNNSYYSSVDGVLFDKSQTTLIQFPSTASGVYAIPGGVTSISDGAFSDCTGLSSVTIPDSVISIGSNAFYGCAGLNAVTIPNGVTSIGSSAFYGCYDLSSVTIAGSVTNIGDYTFAYCGYAIAVYFQGNAPAAGSSVFYFDPVGVGFPYWTVVYYLPGTTGWDSFSANTGVPVVSWPDALYVIITPASAITNGAQWQVDGGSFQNSGATVTNLTVGNHVVSFSAISAWTTPASQSVTITNGATTTAIGFYIPAATPANGLILLTNGFGAIHHETWPENLLVGEHYTVKAMPKTKNLFVNWVGGTNQPYSVLSSSASYMFTMESNLVLEANFVTNSFLAAHGNYRGLFAPTNLARQQTNSGAFSLSVTRDGAVSGKLELDGHSVPLSGRFEPDGTAEIISKPVHGIPSLTTALQLDFADQSVGGTVSNDNFTAELVGYRDAFSKSDEAAELVGRYTLIIPGTNDPSVGPFGTSYGTVNVDDLGIVTLVGSLADGTAISQSSVVSQDGYWPLYVNLYGGKGSLWGWNYFTNHTLTNDSPISWINATNSARTAVYRSGFTNQEATLTGGIYIQSQVLPADLIAILEGGNLPFAITNGVTLTTSDKITLTNSLDETNKLKLRIKKSTGMITGSFANPDDPKQSIKIHGVILQGQTNAQGYFLGTNQSGAFLLDSPSNTQASSSNPVVITDPGDGGVVTTSTGYVGGVVITSGAFSSAR